LTHIFVESCVDFCPLIRTHGLEIAIPQDSNLKHWRWTSFSNFARLNGMAYYAYSGCQIPLSWLWINSAHSIIPLIPRTTP